MLHTLPSRLYGYIYVRVQSAEAGSHLSGGSPARRPFSVQAQERIDCDAMELDVFSVQLLIKMAGMACS